MKNIVIVTYYYNTDIVNGKRITYLSEYFSENNYNVNVIKSSTKECKENKEAVSKKGLKITNIDTKNKFWMLKRFEWINCCKENIEKIHKKNKIDLIIFTGSPFFYFHLGPYFKKKYNIKYLLDFRDPWTLKYASSTIGIKQKILLNSIYKRQEKEAVENADLVLSVTESFVDLYKKHFDKADKNKFKVIENGFDDKQITKDLEIELEVKTKKLKIGASGTISYTPEHHTKVKDIIDKTKNALFIHIGKNSHFVEDFDKEHFISLGKKNYIENINILKKMDCLFLTNYIDDAIGTKIYDYIYINKPIIAFVNKNSLIGSILKKFKNNFIVENHYEMQNAIDKIIDQKLINLDENIDTKKYSRKEQMKKLESYIRVL